MRESRPEFFVTRRGGGIGHSSKLMLMQKVMMMTMLMILLMTMMIVVLNVVMIMIYLHT